MTDEVQFIAKPSFLRNHADVLFAAAVGLLVALMGMAILSNLLLAIGGQNKLNSYARSTSPVSGNNRARA